MSTASHGPQQLKDRIVQDRVHRERDQFIAAIHEDDVCRLASSHHNGDHCSFFQPPSVGVTTFVILCTFRRIALVKMWRSGWLVAEKTTIPLPKIYAYNLGDGSEPLSSFIIFEYIEGEKLSYARLKTLTDGQQSCLYTSLADIYIQLRRLEFPSIGCLAHGPEGCNVRKKITTIDTNMQELEGLQPSNIQSSFYNNKGVLTSANDYVAMLLQIADNAFVNGRNSISEKDQGEDALYYLHISRQYAKGWTDCRVDQGPFVMVHGDLEPFNLMVNEHMVIVSVLDWEWSRVVPLQFFKPPLWLKNPDTTKLAWNFVYQDYLKSLDQLLEIVRTREREKYGDELLSNEWAKAKENSGFLVANALENWTDIDWFALRYIKWKCYKNKDLNERVKAFMNGDSARKALISRKLRENRLDGLDDMTIKSALCLLQDLRWPIH